MEGKRLGDAKSSPKVSPGGRGGARTETGILTPGPVLFPKPDVNFILLSGDKLCGSKLTMSLPFRSEAIRLTS